MVRIFGRVKNHNIWRIRFGGNHYMLWEVFSLRRPRVCGVRQALKRR